MKLTLPDIRWNVALLNGAALIFISALVGMFFWVVDRIDDRFDRVDEPVRQVQMTIAAQTETLKGIDRRLEQVDDKLSLSERPLEPSK